MQWNYVSALQVGNTCTNYTHTHTHTHTNYFSGFLFEMINVAISELHLTANFLFSNYPI